MKTWEQNESGLWIFEDVSRTVTTADPSLAPRTLTIEEVAKAVAEVSINSLTLRQFLLLCALYDMRTEGREFSGYLSKPFDATEMSSVSGYLARYTSAGLNSGRILTSGEFNSTGYETVLLCVATVQKWMDTLAIKDLPESLISPFGFVRELARKRLQELQHNRNLESNEDHK